jgi:predicted XRE-type DNA-binding protein
VIKTIHVDRELRDLLAREVCALVADLGQMDAALQLGLSQPHVSLLRRGQANGFPVSRLLRVLAAQHYDVEVTLRRRPRPFARPYVPPQVTVVRYDRDGREVSRNSLRDDPKGPEAAAVRQRE